MRRLLTLVVCLGVVAFAAAVTQAGPASLLFLDGRINQLEDNDWEDAVFNGDRITDPTDPDFDAFELKVGDFLYGLFEIQQTLDARDSTNFIDPDLEGFTGVFALKVKSIDTVGSQFKYNFEPLSDTEWDTIFDFDDDPLVRENEDSLAVVFLDSRASMSDAFVDPGNPEDQEFALKTAYLNTTDALWEFGFNGDDGEFWFGVATSKNFLDPFLNVQTNVALNVTHTYDAASSILLHKHGELFGDLTSPNLIRDEKSFTQVQAFGNFGTGDKGAWPIRTDTDFYIKPTPEPGSLALLGLGLAAFGGYAWRRRRKS